MKSIFFYFAFCLVPLITIAQDQELWYNSVNIPPSPNASSLVKFIEIPVNKSTGVPSITVPIVEINQPNLTIPITLQYHGGGIKVEESSSWVGLGWTLSSGGVITRVTRGLPDDTLSAEGYGFHYLAEKVPNDYKIGPALSVSGLRDSVYDHLQLIADGHMDYEPDMFYYSYGQHSGSFVLGVDGNPVTLPYEDIKIEPIYQNGEIVIFRLIDGDGIIYWFGGDETNRNCRERTNIDVRGPDQPPFVSCWYICKIYNPNTRTEINFYYDSYYYTQSICQSQTQIYTVLSGGSLQPGQLTINNSTIIIPDAKILDSITFDNGKVLFSNSESIEGGFKIDTIKWTNLNKERTFSLTYGTFGNNRLKLSSISEVAEQESHYSFEYSNIQVPSKTSSAQDHWGYYNGITGNSNLLPLINYDINNVIGYSNRSIDSLYTQAGVLIRINYPTGGYSEFTYENNSYGRNKIAEDISVQGGKSIAVTGTGFITIVTDETQISFSQDSTYCDFYLNANINYLEGEPIDSTHNIGSVKVFDETLQSEIFFSSVNAVNPIQNEPLNLDVSHVYKIRVTAAGEVTTTEANIQCDVYKTQELTGFTKCLAGGIRVKSIKEYDENEIVVMERNFDYGINGYLTHTLPNYTKSMTSFEHIYPNTITSQLVFLYSSPVNGPGASSNSVSYEQVDEYLGSLNENRGRITTKFIKQTDEGVNTSPFRPFISKQWLRSKVLEEKQSAYNSLSNNYFDIITKRNYYSQNLPSTLHSVMGFKATRVQSHTGYMIQPDFLNDIEYSNFYIDSYWHRIDSQEVYNYFENDVLMTKIGYFYDSELHTNPTRVITANSEGDTVKTLTKYPLDYTTLEKDYVEDYYNSVYDCKTSIITSNTESIVCLNGDYLQCKKERDICLYDAYITSMLLYYYTGDYYYGESACNDQFNECLDEGYNECLVNNSDCYTPCMLSALSNYRSADRAFINTLTFRLDSISEIQQEPLSFMVKRHMVNTPIEKIIFVNDQMVDHIKWDYALKDSMIVVQQSVERSFSENPTEVEASFPEYDTNGNPLQVIEKVVGFSKSYKWGYNGRYPIAEILNAEPNEVFYTSFEEDTCTSCIKNETKSKTGSSYFELSNAFVINSLPQGDYWLTYFWKENANDPWEYIIEDNKSTTSLSTLKSSGYIDELRCFPQDAQMTTFSYEPLIGISSRTDANGNTIYYNYDNIGRLVTIKDNNQKILKLIKYNYGD